MSIYNPLFSLCFYIVKGNKEMNDKNNEGYHDPTTKMNRYKQKISSIKAIRHPHWKNKIIAVDFDGTIVKNAYPNIGRPNYFLIAQLIELSKNNTLILWTCRNNKLLEDALNFCKALGLNFNYVNENCKKILDSYGGVDSRKITADIYIDDKARCRL